MPRFIDLTKPHHELPDQDVLARYLLGILMGKTPEAQPISLETFLYAQAGFSSAMFGPLDQRSPRGPLDHLVKEIRDEIQPDPENVGEWCDAILLSIDGALRAAAATPGTNPVV